MFMCDPFGRSDPDSVVNFGSDDIHEHNYIFFFDQEPIHLNIHTATFKEVVRRNEDLWGAKGAICTSEQDSDSVDALVKHYGWKTYYYFFHGWAALDWYRGYDKTFLIRPVQDRLPTKTFLAPNRIIAGERQHRLEMLYWVFKLNMTDNHISCPAVCPVENISIAEATEPLLPVYADIQQVFAEQQLPINFAGETDHPMHSCWLSLFDQAADSLLYLVTETVATGRRHHITEKTFKPIAMGMPFVLVATQGSLEYLRSYGFKTFGHVWDESYDSIADPHQRIKAVADLLKTLDDQTAEQRQLMLQQCQEVIEHNWNHFYDGGFEAVLWQELRTMLDAIEL
jgi:hypothetical protein